MNKMQKGEPLSLKIVPEVEKEQVSVVELVVGKDINLRTNNSQSNLSSSCSVKKIDSQTCKYNPAILWRHKQYGTPGRYFSFRS